MVLRPRLTTGLPFSQSTKGGAPTQCVVMTETSGAVKGGAKGRAPALGAAVASIHRATEKGYSRKLGFRCTGFSEVAVKRSRNLPHDYPVG